MKRGIEYKYDVSEFNFKILKKRIILAIIILIIGIIIYFAYFRLLTAKECKDLECYEKSLLNCKKIWVINEDNKSVWRYEILNEASKNSCNVKVILLKVKEATLEAEVFQGKEMICVVNKVDDIFPEKDMLRCSGVLKEKLQEIIIDRMHNYLLKNLGEIQKGLKEI